MQGLTLDSNDYGVLGVHRLMHMTEPGSVPTHVVSLPRSRQWFCSSLNAAGRLMQDISQWRINDNDISTNDIHNCMIVPFQPMMYRTDAGTLEMILQSCEETWFLLRWEEPHTEWVVYWNWNLAHPEYEHTLYPPISLRR